MVRVNRGVNIVFIIELFARGINENSSWQKIMASPIIPVVFTGTFNIRLSIRNPNPIAAITSKIKVWKPRSKKIPKFTKVNSSNMSQSPRFARNSLLSDGVLFLLERYADVPARKTNMGAHR